jgi:putative inorganic carbon (HCO3(-)) transporter
MWSRAIYILEDFPFTGVGMGAYTQVVDRLYPFLRFAPGSAGHAHNLFLQIGSDLGFPGLVAWLAAFFCICVGGVSLYQRSLANKDGWLTGLSAGLLAFQLALVIHGLSDAVTWGMVRPAPLVWYLWGLMVAGLLIAPHSIGAVNLADETVLKVDEQFI